MFPSNNITNVPIFYSDQPPQQAFQNGLFFSDNNIALNSRQGEPPPPSSFFQIPSSNLPYDLDLELELLAERDGFFQQSHDLLVPQHQPLRGVTSLVSETIANMVDSGKNEVSDVTKICNYTISQINSSQKKRSSKRDRHSKINTAQGPRDRRMRLSLKVARDFFDLQDKLGFDKPSKTVEWLLIQAKHEIRKLSGGYSCSTVVGSKSASSTSEGEVVSGIDDAPVKENAPKSNVSVGVRKEKKSRAVRKTAFFPRGRESRDIARAKARERTKEKMARKHDEPKASEEATNQELHQLGSWSSFETGEESGTQSHNLNPSVDVAMEVDAPSSHEHHQFGSTDGLLDDDLGIITKWSPSSSIFNLHNNGVSEEQHHFTDLQSLYKPWEAYNNLQSLG